MKLAFCTPFKPLTHPRVSGDVTIADDLANFFVQQGHDVWIVPHVPTRYIWKTPHNWGHAFATMQLVKETLRSTEKPDLWFTYHSYYKAPDILGTLAAKEDIPYAIFAPSHAPKRKRQWSTKAGFYLNKSALRQATHVFTNKQRDIECLKQVVETEKITFIPPGIRTDTFCRDESAREENRRQWRAEKSIVVLTVAMLREGVKSDGVEHVITACHALQQQGHTITLVIAGDGVMRPHLEKLAQALLPKQHIFLGAVSQKELPQLYSSCDIFAFPGINEGLGMVYLEAQSCGLPVVAWDHDGAPQMVQHNVSGFITPSFDNCAFAAAIGKLASSQLLRKKMGAAAAFHAATHHSIATNYSLLNESLCSLTRRHHSG